MVDNTTSSAPQTSVAAPEAAAPSSPAVDNAAPAPAPAVEAVAPVTAAESSKSEATATIETAPAETKATTVLGGEAEPADNKAPEKKTEEAKEAPVEGETKKEEAAQSDEPAPLPTYEAFALPEGVTYDDVKLGEFTKELGEFQNLTKADQAEMQKFGQKLLDRHIAEVKETAQRLNEYYVNTWEKQKTDWKTAFESDPEIGGDRKDTTVKAALQFIRTHGGNENQQKEFRDLMEATGIGNHPAMIRILAKANMNMSEGKPLPGTKPELQATSKVAKRYGGNS